jgi:hypothetical protein
MVAEVPTSGSIRTPFTEIPRLLYSSSTKLSKGSRPTYPINSIGTSRRARAVAELHAHPPVCRHISSTRTNRPVAGMDRTGLPNKSATRIPRHTTGFFLSPIKDSVPQIQLYRQTYLLKPDTGFGTLDIAAGKFEPALQER